MGLTQKITFPCNRKEELELDNFNILYVALTRAIEQLYIISEKSTKNKEEEIIRHTSGLFISYLKKNLTNKPTN